MDVLVAWTDHPAAMDAVTVDVLVAWTLSTCRHGCGDSGCAGSW